MQRRDFINLLGCAAATWPLRARAQQPAMPVIGFFGTGTPSSWSQWTSAFVNRLRELGWIEGRTVEIEYRWAEGRDDRYARIAAELVRLKVAVIVTQGTPSVLAAKQATSVIPIVFASAGDPVGNGLVENLARPNGNVTGLSSQATDSAPKRLELLREAVPTLRTLAIIADAGNPFSMLEVGEVQAAARTLGLNVATSEIRRVEDIAPAFNAIKGRAEALFISTDPLLIANLTRINALAQSAQVPTIGSWREFVEAGSLMSYGSDIPEQFRRAAEMVDRILRGAKPGDIPVEQPTKFEFLINLKTAKALGLTVPPSLLARADEVIE
jgi:putative tryptophan/tyrosine transport system substrate-binding protein